MEYGTIIKPCTCNHEYQDKKYGEKQRVHNLCKKGAQSRCTVCKTMKFK